MDENHFNAQMDRLKSQWKNSYGEERTARLWLQYKAVANSVFTGLVDLAIDRQRAAPLAEDFAKLENEYRNRQAQERAYSGFSRPGGIMGEMETAAKINKKADPDFVKACMQLLRDRQSGKITQKQFLEGCDYLDGVADQLNPTGRRRSSYSGGGSYSGHTAPRD